jgi:hypothetical protein
VASTYNIEVILHLIGFLILSILWSRSWLLRGLPRILVSDTTKRCLQSPEDQDEDRGAAGRLTSTYLITQGSRLHGSSKLYNHRAQGCEGELGVAAVSCGSTLVSQCPPAEALDVAEVPAEHTHTTQGSLAVRERIYTTQGSLAVREHIYTTQGSLAVREHTLTIAGLITARENLLTQHSPAGLPW